MGLKKKEKSRCHQVAMCLRHVIGKQAVLQSLPSFVFVNLPLTLYHGSVDLGGTCNTWSPEEGETEEEGEGGGRGEKLSGKHYI